MYSVSQNVLFTNIYSRSQNRPRTECIQNTKRITYYKMYCAPICIPQPRAELNSQMQKRLSCSYRLVSRSLNPPVSLSAFTPFSYFCFSSILLLWLLVSISFKVLKSGFSLAVAYFLSHFLLMSQFKRNWSLSECYLLCDML